ncbi:hypothetical protein [Sphingomicrobium arenosum]|uniref:hypothetical protein n=1 Tax=Sphingomicrobium arenosum TaxID=2233861 RepID=UPI00223EBD4A|nr:hypothetical protein [Sphingomicrobium arenosum]
MPFIIGFFWLPTLFLGWLSWHSRNGDYCGARDPVTCLPGPSHHAIYVGLFLVFLGVSAVTSWWMLWRR